MTISALAGLRGHVISVLIGLILGWFARSWLAMESPTTPWIINRVQDTVWTQVTVPAIKVQSLAKVVRIHDTIVVQVDSVRDGKDVVRVDTILRSEPFIAKLDTVIGQRDTISAALRFPPAEWVLDFRRARDSIPRITVYEQQVIQEKPTFVEWVSIAGAGAIVGLLTGLAVAQ